MKKITLLLVALLSTMFVSAQTEHFIDWFTGVGTGGNLTIEVGDTVTWTWADNLSHSVTSDGGSTEAFDSGIETGLGFTFSHTFTLVGTNPYGCNVHAGMNGTITVEAIASIEDNVSLKVSYFPNPVTEKLTISSKHSLSTYEVFNILGQKVDAKSVEGTTVTIDMSKLNTGIYFVNIKSNDLQKIIKVVKK